MWSCENTGARESGPGLRQECRARFVVLPSLGGRSYSYEVTQVGTSGADPHRLRVCKDESNLQLLYKLVEQEHGRLLHAIFRQGLSDAWLRVEFE